MLLANVELRRGKRASVFPSVSPPTCRLSACRLGSDQATLLIFKNYRPKSNYFQALNPHFYGPKCPCKKLMAPAAHSSHLIQSLHALSLCPKLLLRHGHKWSTPHRDTPRPFPIPRVLPIAHRPLHRIRRLRPWQPSAEILSYGNDG